MLGGKKSNSFEELGKSTGHILNLYPQKKEEKNKDICSRFSGSPFQANLTVF